MNERRANDPLVAQLVADVAAIKSEMTTNTEVTKQVRDILASFRVLGAVCKWLAALGAAIAVLVHGVEYVRHP